MTNTTIALLCGLPYAGKSSLLKESGAPCLKVDDVLQERYGTSNPRTISHRLSAERPAFFRDFAKQAVKLASECGEETFWIEGMFTRRPERDEMQEALKKAGAKKIGCLFLANVKMEELLDRCKKAKKAFRCPLVVLVDRIASIQYPDASEGFDWIRYMQPVQKSLREDEGWK